MIKDRQHDLHIRVQSTKCKKSPPLVLCLPEDRWSLQGAGPRADSGSGGWGMEKNWKRSQQLVFIVIAYIRAHWEYPTALCWVPLDFWPYFELAELKAGRGCPGLFRLDPGANKEKKHSSSTTRKASGCRVCMLAETGEFRALLSQSLGVVLINLHFTCPIGQSSNIHLLSTCTINTYRYTATISCVILSLEIYIFSGTISRLKEKTHFI